MPSAHPAVFKGPDPTDTGATRAQRQVAIGHPALAEAQGVPDS